MKWSFLAFAALLPLGAVAKEKLQYWREVRLGRADVLAALGDCNSDDAHLRACLAALDGAGRWTNPPRRVAARPDFPLENVTIRFPVWPAQVRAQRKRYDDLEALIKARRGLPLDFDSRLTELEKSRRAELPAAFFWAQALEGGLKSSDGFASLMPHAELQDEEQGKNDYSGLGLNVDFLSRGVIVHEVRADSPAAHAGLRAEDRLVALAVGGAPFRPVDESAGALVAELNLLPGGARARVRIEREGQTLEFEMIRAPFPRPNVESDYERGIGYLRLRSFGEITACTELADAIQARIADGARGLILDLRGNGGGMANVANCVAGLFLGDGTVSGFVGQGETRWHTAGFTQLTKLPLVALIDGGSASASELVAGALQNGRRAWLVGERTFGKATRQGVKPYLGGLDRATTEGYFVLSDGRIHQGVGLTPDFTRPYRAGASDDDRFQERVDDLIFSIPVPRGHSWLQTRPGSAMAMEECAGKQLPAEPARLDNQRLFATAVLRCEGVTENGSPSGDQH